MKDWHMFSSKNPDSWMMLGLLNTLSNNGTITKEQREDIYNLGRYIERMGKVEDAGEVKALLEELMGKIKNDNL